VHAHRNRSDKVEAVLFQVNDIPVLKSLGLYREEAA
jgi:gentisate 1,2-dioxygenase